MTFQFIFYGGPLDGFRLDGSYDDAPLNRLDVGHIAFRHSEQGRVGALFDTFYPLVLTSLPSPRPPIRLHTYQVTNRVVGALGRLQILAGYVGPSERMLPEGPGGLGQWAYPDRTP